MSEKNRESLKGKWNKIGAPPKKVHWPYGKFTREQLFARNPDQCELTLIIKVKKAVGPANGQGEIVELTPLKQPNGSVGAPIHRYIRSKYFDPLTMKLRDYTPKQKAAPAVLTTVAPATPPVPPIVDDLPINLVIPPTIAQ